MPDPIRLVCVFVSAEVNTVSVKFYIDLIRLCGNRVLDPIRLRSSVVLDSAVREQWPVGFVHESLFDPIRLFNVLSLLFQ